MNEYNEQAVETLDDAGCIIANKNIIIDNLQARIAELEEENAGLKAAVEYAETIRVENIAYFEKQLATSQLRETQLGEALQAYIDEHEECQDADDWMAMMCSMEAHHAADEALAQPSDTSALDSFVAEKVKDENDQILAAKNLLAIMHRDGGHHEFAVGFDQAIQDAMAVYYELTRQRDLAVDAMRVAAEQIRKCDYTPARSTLLVAIKESEAK